MSRDRRPSNIGHFYYQMKQQIFRPDNISNVTNQSRLFLIHCHTASDRLEHKLRKFLLQKIRQFLP